MNPNEPNNLNSLLTFLSRLKQAGLSYRLNQVRKEAVLVEVTVPGERWEVEFFADATIEIERFKSDGQIFDASRLEEWLEDYED